MGVMVRRGGRQSVASVRAVVALAIAVSLNPIWPHLAVAVTPREFVALSDKDKVAVLGESIRHRQHACCNIALTTSSRVQKVEWNPSTKVIDRFLEDFGRRDFDVKRIEGSYRLGLSRFRPGQTEPQVPGADHYDAKTGTLTSFCMQNTGGFAQHPRPLGAISTIQAPTTAGCRYASYLGGLGFLLESEDYYTFLLNHLDAAQIEEFDEGTGTIVVRFPYQVASDKETGICLNCLDIGKDFLLVRRVIEANQRLSEPGHQRYEKAEVQESQKVDGVWLPTRFTMLTWLSDSSIGPVGNLWETTAEDIRIGQVSPRDLNVEFPVGTLVRDEITGKQYVIGESREQLPYNPVSGAGSLGPDGTVKITNASSSGGRAAGPRGTGSTSLWLWCVTGCILVGVLSFSMWQYAKRQRG